MASGRLVICDQSKGVRTKPSRPLFERFLGMFRSRRRSRLAPRKRSTSIASARTTIRLRQGGELRIWSSIKYDDEPARFLGFTRRCWIWQRRSTPQSFDM
jgi:hypothetical protein